MGSNLSSCSQTSGYVSPSVQAKRILLVDDDVSLCELLSEYLGRDGYEVDSVHNGSKALSHALSGNYDAAILDLMLPGIKGLEILRWIRIRSKLPVLILTAKGEEIDRIIGLEAGADDYLPKPVNPRELTARLDAVLRRADPWGGSPTDTLQHMNYADLRLDPAARTVRSGNSILNLTTTEFDLLRVLLRHVGQAVTREDLAQQALGRDFSPFDRSIDLHISHLRRKLGRFRDGSERIKAIRGVGYMCVYPAERSSV